MVEYCPMRIHHLSFQCSSSGSLDIYLKKIAIQRDIYRKFPILVGKSKNLVFPIRVILPKNLFFKGKCFFLTGDIQQ